MLVYVAISIIVMILYVYYHKTMSDLQFYMFALILVTLYILMQLNNKHIEKFDEQEAITLQKSAESTAPAQQPVTQEHAQLNSINILQIFSTLPGRVKGIIVPELDYIVASLSQNGDDKNQEGSQDSKIVIEDQDFIDNKDKDVTSTDAEGKTVIVKSAMETLRLNYKNIDNMLLILQKNDATLYEQFIKSLE